ncbi:unnamed protein product [Alternaria burnsii]|nr:unnamed protein product [Alternaria burnsii]
MGAVKAFFKPLSTMVLAIRFFTRKCIVGKISLSDYIMAIALLFTWGLCACNHYQLFFGSGTKSNPKVPPTVSIVLLSTAISGVNMLNEDLKATKEETDAFWEYWLFGTVASWYAYHIGYLFIMSLIKLSILCFYLGFATQRIFRRLVITSIVVVVVIGIFCVFIVAFQCLENPSDALSPAILSGWGDGHCFDLRIVLYWQAGWSLGSDLFVLLLPMPILLALRMPRGKRLSVIAIFAVSLLIPIASGIRLWSLFLWANSGDFARYYSAYIIFWSQVEINTAIMCASAPSIQPLLKRMLNRIPCGRPSHSPSYYYGGRTSLPWLTAVEMERNLWRNSIDVLESPTRTYCSSGCHANDQDHDQMSISHNTEEEDIRARVRALSCPQTVYLRPTSLSSICSLPLQANNNIQGG